MAECDTQPRARLQSALCFAQLTVCKVGEEIKQERGGPHFWSPTLKHLEIF